MAIENVILTREGFSEINKLASYISTMVIKNDAEGKEYETESAIDNYLKYESAYSDSKSIYSFEYTEDDLKKYFTPDYIKNKNLNDPDAINELILKNDPKSIEFIKYLQQKFLDNYIELNQYYRQFTGLPMDLSDEIYIQNLDTDDPDDLVKITQIKENTHPVTYDYLYIKRNIDSIIKEHNNLVYLKFIETPISPFLLRKLPDFSILYSDKGILDEDELARFSKAYNQARIYVSEQLYVKGRASRYPIYSNCIILMILYYTVCCYFNFKLEDYSLRKYTRYDIYDILESEGLKNLTKIDNLELLRKIVMNLDDLNAYKGTEYVLQLLFDLLDDSSVTVKRFNLVKDFRTNNLGILDLDTTQLYSKSVNLKFKEEQITTNKNKHSIKEASNEAKNTNKDNVIQYTDYDTKVINDDTWGGIDKYMDEDTKAKIKSDLKTAIIAQNFDELPTKYLSISKTLNLFEKSTDSMNILYLVLNYYYSIADPDTNPFENSSINIQGVEMNPISLFGAMIYVNSVLNGNEDPWRLGHDRSLLYSVYTLRTLSGLKEQLPDIQNEVIDIGNPMLNTTIGELLPNEKELMSYLTTFNINEYSTLAQLLNEYDHIKPVFDIITKKIEEEQDAAKSFMWRKLDEFNRSVFDFTNLFKNKSNLREYFSEVNPALLSHLETLYTNYVSTQNDLAFKNYLELCLQRFETFMNNILESTNKSFSFSSSGEDEKYLEDLKILMMEYTSILSELYSVEQVISINDPPNNRLHILWQDISTRIKDEFNEYWKLIFEPRKINLKFKEFFTMMFEHELFIKYKETIKENIELKYDMIKSFNSTGYDDRINLIYDEHYNFKEKLDDSVNINFDLVKIEVKE